MKDFDIVEAYLTYLKLWALLALSLGYGLDYVNKELMSVIGL